VTHSTFPTYSRQTVGQNCITIGSRKQCKLICELVSPPTGHGLERGHVIGTSSASDPMQQRAHTLKIKTKQSYT
jgi:hypothetical protein